MIESLTVMEGLQIALYGFVTVFIMLAALMLIINVMSKLVGSAEKKEEPVNVAAKQETVVEEKVEENKIDTNTYVGEIKLIDCDEKTAACIMAIISDQTQIPLQNLIFKKIQLVGEE